MHMGYFCLCVFIKGNSKFFMRIRHNKFRCIFNRFLYVICHYHIMLYVILTIFWIINLTAIHTKCIPPIIYGVVLIANLTQIKRILVHIYAEFVACKTLTRLYHTHTVINPIYSRRIELHRGYGAA